LFNFVIKPPENSLVCVCVCQSEVTLHSLDRNWLFKTISPYVFPFHVAKLQHVTYIQEIAVGFVACLSAGSEM